MKDQVDQLKQRTMRYWYIDGLTEMAFGLICAVLALYFFGQVALPRGTLLYTLLDSGFLLILLVTGWIATRVVQAVKNRVTYPRTGYVAYRPAKPYYRWVAMGISLLLGAIMASLFSAAPENLAWMPAASGIMISGVLLYLGSRIGIMRFFVLSLASLIVGVGLAISGLENLLGLSLYYGLLSLALFISGGLTLWSFLLTPLETVEASDDQ